MLTSISDYIRYALYAIIVILLLMLYQAWEKEHSKLSATQTQSIATKTTNDYIPEVTAASTSEPVTKNAIIHPNHPKQIIHVTTDTLQVDIDTQGGNIIKVNLLKYPKELNAAKPFELLNDDVSTRYLAQSGLLGTQGPDTSENQGTYVTDKTNYTFSHDQNDLEVKLVWQNNQGLQIAKIFQFKRNNYEIDIHYQINNQSKQPWEGNFYAQLMRKNTPPPNGQGFSNLTTYFGAAISSPEKPFQKVSFKEMEKTTINQPILGGWAAMIQHYFVSAWVPNKNTTSQYFSRITKDGLYTIGMIGPKITANPGAIIDTTSKFYAGPAIAENLEKVAPGLKLTIDYGWFWFISVIIFWMMQKIYSIVGNWGWSIVLVTLVIKLLFYQLSAKSYYSMNALKKLQPRIEELKQRFGDDKQKFTQATLELYKKEKANPMSGCLPILIQIPVFIALYWVLIESVELRQAPFILWIHDLSIKDPYYVLPILMGLSMLVQQKLSPPPPDPMQAKIMMLMPVIFTVLFVNFPAGLMLYWFVNNTVSVLQQWFIMHRMEKVEKSKSRK